MRLLLATGENWDKEVEEVPQPWIVFGLYLVPIVVCGLLPEYLSLTHWGALKDARVQRGLTSPWNAFSHEAFCGVNSVILVFVAAWFLILTGSGVLCRINYRTSFTVITFSLAPLFLLRMLNAIPALDPWFVFGIGLFLSLAVLKRAIQRFIQPSPTQAFGLYISAALMIIALSATVRFINLPVNYSYDRYIDDLRFTSPVKFDFQRP